MTVFAAELSSSGFADMKDEVDGMDAKTALGWIWLTGHLCRFGSIRATEEALCGVLKVTRGHLRKKAWPWIENRVVLSEDGTRYMLPDATRDRRSQAVSRAPEAPVAKSARHQRAANIRHHGDIFSLSGGAEVEPSMHPDASADASPMHDFACNGDARNPAKSTDDACGFASPMHNPASDAPPTRSLSLSEGFSSESQENPAVPEREREPAPASAPAIPDATADATDASRDAKPDASRDAKPDASRDAKPKAKPSKPHPLPDDWQAPAEVTAAIEQAGRDPALIAAQFCSHYRAKGEVRADWGHAYRSWWLRQPAFDPLKPQIPLVRSLSGGNGPADPVKQAIDKAADLAAETAACAGTGPDSAFARAMRRVRIEVGDSMYRIWLAKLTLGGIEGNEALIYAETAFLRDYVRANFGDHLLRAFRRDSPSVTRLTFESAAGAQRYGPS